MGLLYISRWASLLSGHQHLLFEVGEHFPRAGKPKIHSESGALLPFPRRGWREEVGA